MSSHWLAEIFYWTCFSGIALLAAWLLYRAVIGRRSTGPHCPKCWYDMTGAPSLTCPECGADAMTTARLQKRRRSRKSVAIMAVLLGIACWYSLHVRHRVRHLGESTLQALVPTTALILYFDDTSVHHEQAHFDVFQRRWLGDQGMNPIAPTWQVRLYAWKSYRCLQHAPPDTSAGHPAQPWVWPLTTLSEFDSYAASLHARTIVEHPVQGIRLQAAWELTGREVPRPLLRAAVWRAIELGRLKVGDVARSLAELGPDQFKTMGDQQFLRELNYVGGNSDDTYRDELMELYLLELIQRPTVDRLAVIAQLPPGKSPLRQLLIDTARARIGGEPDPLKIALTLQSAGTELKVRITNQSKRGIALQTLQPERPGLFGIEPGDNNFVIYLSASIEHDTLFVNGSGWVSMQVVTDQLSAGQTHEQVVKINDWPQPYDGRRVRYRAMLPYRGLFSPQPKPGSLYPHAELVVPSVNTPTSQRSRQDSNLRPVD